MLLHCYNVYAHTLCSQRCRAGSSATEESTELLRILYCTAWFTYSLRRATTTTALPFRHREVSGSPVTGILPIGLVHLFGHVAGTSEQELYQAYRM
jgi:hypothetical protein